MAGSANDYRLAALGTNLGDGSSCLVRAEIDYYIGMCHDRPQIVIAINLAGHLYFREMSGARQKRSPHSAL
jgi:hypothetical protein